MFYVLSILWIHNDGINKYNDRNIVQGVINDIIGNTIVSTMVDSSNEATAASELGNTKPVVVHENNHGNTKLANTELKFNNILGAHIVEKKEGWVYGWAPNISSTVRDWRDDAWFVSEMWVPRLAPQLGAVFTSHELLIMLIIVVLISLIKEIRYNRFLVSVCVEFGNMAFRHLFFTVHRINRHVSGIGVAPEIIIYSMCS